MARPKADSFPWIRRTQAAELVGFSARQFDEVIRPRLEKLGEDARRGTGANLRYNASAVVREFTAYRVDQVSMPVAALDGDDPAMAGGPVTPQMERWRKFRADLSEREVLEMDKKLVRRDVLFAAIAPALTGLRNMAIQLVAKHGNEAGELYNEAITEFIASIEQLMRKAAADVPFDHLAAPPLPPNAKQP